MRVSCMRMILFWGLLNLKDLKLLPSKNYFTEEINVDTCIF